LARMSYIDSTMTRDQQRSRVYDAERSAQGCCFPVEQLTLIQCAKLIKQCARFTHGPSPELKDGRGRRRAAGSWRVIKLPVWARTRWTICHEYAHALKPWASKDPWHGPIFAGDYIRLVRRFIGPLEADILKLSFREHRVKFRKLVKIGIIPLGKRAQ
jgi:hypothetical protein